jgi:hypothetical protein
LDELAARLIFFPFSNKLTETEWKWDIIYSEAKAP